MINLILAIALSSMNSPKVAKDISPCVWPKCMKTVEVAQVQPCIWPKCLKPELVNFDGQIETCQWPKKCGTASL